MQKSADTWRVLTHLSARRTCSSVRQFLISIISYLFRENKERYCGIVSVHNLHADVGPTDYGCANLWWSAVQCRQRAAAEDADRRRPPLGHLSACMGAWRSVDILVWRNHWKFTGWTSVQALYNGDVLWKRLNIDPVQKLKMKIPALNTEQNFIEDTIDCNRDSWLWIM